MEKIIPIQELFASQASWLLLIVTAVAVLILSKGADWLVDGAAGLARRAGMPKVIIGATIVSLGTTSPEAAVSVMAAWQGNAGLALGNAIGSVICDAGLIFGVGCLLTTLPADRFVLNRQGWVQVGVAVFLTGLCYVIWFIQGDNATLDRWVGVLLLTMLVAYMLISVRWARQHPQGVPEPDMIDPSLSAQAPKESQSPVPALVLMSIIGLALVILASHVMITSVSTLAVRWGVPEVVIAGTLVALGTSMPELVIGITSIRKGHAELLVGNVIGADILNVLFVTGAAAAAKPLPIIEATSNTPAIFLWLHLPVMLAILVLFRVFIAASVKRGSFRRWYGLPLLLIYIGYVAAGFLLTGKIAH
ncbi:MAG: sodium:calcium antiporter [Phycisphaeraceae bacterium]